MMNEYSKQKYLFTVEITKLSVFIKINLYKKNPIKPYFSKSYSAIGNTFKKINIF